MRKREEARTERGVRRDDKKYKRPDKRVQGSRNKERKGRKN